MDRPLIIGTRGSALALCQSEMVRGHLLQLGHGPIELQIVSTTGDRVIDRPLPEVGGKGLFTEELERSLLEGGIDLAVHSLKDLPTEMQPELTVGAIPEREVPFDALVGPSLFGELHEGATVGTSSLRRRAQLLHHRKDLRVIDLRGNLDTRLRKVTQDGDPDAAILAAAGLRRLGLDERITETLPPEFMLPAAGQGALGIQCRADDRRVLDLLSQIEHPPTRAEVEAERALLDRLEGGCHVPIGCLGRYAEGTVTLRGGVFALDGETSVRAELSGDAGEGRALGVQLAERLLQEGADGILAEVNAART